jgi:cap2 methyltransferase
VQEARKVAMPEMCTNAFAKMYEMLESYQLVRTLHSNVFNSLHLCEAPGAFICATNHYIKSRHPQTSWDWIACTLNPYFEGNSRDAMIDDDAFISETMNHWYFGKDNSGDMRLRHNIVGAWEQAKCNLGPIMLVTADGSIDCSDRPSEQEKVVSQLLFCEVVAALGALHPGQSPNSLSQY